MSRLIKLLKQGTNGVFSLGSESTIDAGVNADSTVTSVNGKRTDKFLEESQSKSQLLETVMRLSEKLSGFLNEGSLFNLLEIILVHLCKT